MKNRAFTNYSWHTSQAGASQTGTLSLLLPYLVEGEQIVRTFLITLTASTVASVILWQLGLAAKIWPAHPLLTTVILAALGAAVVQLLLTYDPTTRLK